MQEIRTSGSMSGDGKRSVAAWPKLPRPSSTLPSLPAPTLEFMVGIGGTADIDGYEALADCVENDPSRTSAARFALVPNTTVLDFLGQSWARVPPW
jgi:hypothetical protein